MAKFVTHPAGLQIPREQRVLKAADYHAYLEVTDAQTHAQQTRAQAQADAVAIKEQARQQGLAQGLQAANEQIIEKILQLTQGYAEYVESVESQLPDTLLSLIQRIFADYSDAEKLAGLVQQTLDKLKQEKQVLIRVAIADHADFTRRLQSLLTSKPLETLVEIETDAELVAGQCHVEFEQGLYILDVATLMQQFYELLNLPEGAVPSST